MGSEMTRTGTASYRDYAIQVPGVYSVLVTFIFMAVKYLRNF